MQRRQLVWLKRDLRVEDHQPLLEASRRGPCVILYIYEPEVMAGPDYDARHLLFINQSLSALEDRLSELGGALTIRCGEAVEVLSALHASINSRRFLVTKRRGMRSRFHEMSESKSGRRRWD